MGAVKKVSGSFRDFPTHPLGVSLCAAAAPALRPDVYEVGLAGQPERPARRPGGQGQDGLGRNVQVGRSSVPAFVLFCHVMRAHSRECRLATEERTRLKAMEAEGRKLWQFSEELLAKKGQ